MDFFSLPEELADWLTDVMAQEIHWGIVWHVRQNTYKFLDKGELDLYKKMYQRRDVLYFVGNHKFRPGPIIKHSFAKPELDFKNSLCIRIWPTFIVDDVLLEGNVDTLDPKQYDGIDEKQEFLRWRNRTFRWCKEALSDPSAVATQVLSNGRTKEWKGLVVSLGAFQWYQRGGKLQQFEKGPVEFIPKKKAFH
jgi:hypothetical protein